MTTVNISLPSKLKQQAQELVNEGYYASFSDLIRDALRNTLSLNSNKSKYDVWAEEAWQEHLKGKTKTLKNEKDVEDLFRSL